MYANFDVHDVSEQRVSFEQVFTTNIWLVVKDMVLGLVTGGMYSGVSLSINILSISVIGNGLVLSGYSFLFYKMMPHGMVEIFGMVLAFTSVLYCFYTVGRNVSRIVKREVTIKDTMCRLVVFFIAIIGLEFIIFTIAGIIEVFVSWTTLM